MSATCSHNRALSLEFLNVGFSPAPAFGTGSDDETRVGFTVGGGLEWKILSRRPELRAFEIEHLKIP